MLRDNRCCRGFWTDKSYSFIRYACTILAYLALSIRRRISTQLCKRCLLKTVLYDNWRNCSYKMSIFPVATKVKFFFIIFLPVLINPWFPLPFTLCLCSSLIGILHCYPPKTCRFLEIARVKRYVLINANSRYWVSNVETFVERLKDNSKSVAPTMSVPIHIHLQ